LAVFFGMMHLFLLLLQAVAPGPLTVDEIMARVAENQDRAKQARTEWVYQQEVLARMHRSNGKLAREESWQSVITPKPKGFDKQVLHFEGKYEHKGQFVSYDHPHYEYKSLDVDGDLISDLGEDFANDQGSNDGVGTDLFPLTKKDQAGYVFTLEGREDYRGTEVYRITFRPKRGNETSHGESQGDWKGEALIDVAEFQPVVVTTGLAWGIPGAVKALLGTDLHHVGFKITYKKVADGVWFPAVYGGEFYLKALFLYKRTFSISVKNTDFRKTDVSSKIAYETPQ
jgi:hypothetical protein